MPTDERKAREWAKHYEGHGSLETHTAVIREVAEHGYLAGHRAAESEAEGLLRRLLKRGALETTVSSYDVESCHGCHTEASIGPLHHRADCPCEAARAWLAGRE